MKQEPPNSCPRCGAPLPPDAPQGLCPRCIGAFDFNEETVGPEPPAAPKPPPSPEDIAPHFPQLEILECLGRGGMGVVYKARQKTLGRAVALKILAPERENDPEFAARFTREAQALARLSHPHIVTVHDFGQADGYFYLLMEFVDGVNLRQAMRAGRFTPQQALAVVPQICEALQFAHDRGIVHRDIKPENILLDRQGHVKIADFGVAKIFGREAPPAAGIGEDSGDLTRGKGVVGTPRYMAPEQVTHPLDVDHRADIYSLGVVLYEMLTGELPAASIEPPSKKVLIDVRLDEVVLRALEKEPARRYQRAGEVGTMVETIATTPAGPHAPAKKSGMVRIMETFFDIRFTSPWAIRCLNASALGFLGFLSALRFLEFDELRWTAGFSGLFGLFGLIGVAFLIEMVARRDERHAGASSGDGTPPVRPVSDAVLLQVKGPAIGLVVTGTLNWVAIPLIAVLMASFAYGPDGQPALLVVPVIALVLCSLTIFGALKMKHLESYGWAITAAILAILVSPGNIIGLPLGIWALAVLSRSEVRAAFRRRVRKVPPTTDIGAGVSPANQMAARRTGGQSIACLRPTVVVGRRGDKAVIHWPGVLLGFVLTLAVMEVAATITSLFLGGGVDARTILIVFFLALMITVIRIRRGWSTPIDRLLPLDVPPPLEGDAGEQGPARPEWRMWSFFQPPLVREICSHMIEAERREAVKRSLLFGLWNAMTFFGPMFCVMFMSLPSPMGWIYGGAILIVGLSFYPLWLRMQREFLCSTAWARQRGIKPDDLRGFVPRDVAKGFGGLFWSILIAVGVAIIVRTFVLQTYVATSDAVSPEIPRKSFVLVYKLVRSFAPGDIIVYRDGGRAKLARVAQPGPKKGLLEIDRGTGDPVRLQVAQVSGTVIFNTRPGSGPEPFPSRTISRHASQESPTPGILRVSVETGRAVIEGRATSDSLFVLGVGEDSSTSGFLNDLPFTAIIERVDWGRGIACVIKDSIGNVLLTLGNSRFGPMTYEPGRIVFRKGAPSPEPDGSYVIGEFLSEGRTPLPVKVALERTSKMPAQTQPGPHLQFRLVADANDTAPAETFSDPGSNEPLRVRKEILLDESAVACASVIVSAEEGVSVGVDFNEAGSKRIAQITGANIGKRLAVVFDGRVLSAPTIREAIQGRAVITGNFTAADVAETIASALNAVAAKRPAAKGRDNVLVEDLALRLVAAIRDKEDAVLKDLATDRIPDWREALPQFAFELRERYTHLTGKPFGVFPEDSLVEGDFAVVRCTGPAELQGKCLVLGFVRTPDGWRNWNLRNSMKDVPLQRHLDDFKNAK